jgi:hypothetical protein
MNINVFAILSILAVVLVVSWAWTTLLARQMKKAVLGTYSCPQHEAGEFSGGYRDAVRDNVKCDYTIQMYATPTAHPRCPVHHCNLIKT